MQRKDLATGTVYATTTMFTGLTAVVAIDPSRLYEMSRVTGKITVSVNKSRSVNIGDRAHGVLVLTGSTPDDVTTAAATPDLLNRILDADSSFDINAWFTKIGLNVHVGIMNPRDIAGRWGAVLADQYAAARARMDEQAERTREDIIQDRMEAANARVDAILGSPTTIVLRRNQGSTPRVTLDLDVFEAILDATK